VKNKKWLLVLIIAFPSLFWLILETSTINSRRLPFHGPKVELSKGDTAYHSVPAPFFSGAPLKPSSRFSMTPARCCSPHASWHLRTARRAIVSPDYGNT
jgi:hypothetical protein